MNSYYAVYCCYLPTRVSAKAESEAKPLSTSAAQAENSLRRGEGIFIVKFVIGNNTIGNEKLVISR